MGDRDVDRSRLRRGTHAPLQAPDAASARYGPRRGVPKHPAARSALCDLPRRYGTSPRGEPRLASRKLALSLQGGSAVRATSLGVVGRPRSARHGGRGGGCRPLVARQEDDFPQRDASGRGGLFCRLCALLGCGGRDRRMGASESDALRTSGRRAVDARISDALARPHAFYLGRHRRDRPRGRPRRQARTVACGVRIGAHPRRDGELHRGAAST